MDLYVGLCNNPYGPFGRNPTMNLQFHPDKCSRLQITRSRKSTICHWKDYTLPGQALETTTSAVHLWVTLQNDLRWERHTDNICQGKQDARLPSPRCEYASTVMGTPLQQNRMLGFLPLVVNMQAQLWEPHCSKTGCSASFPSLWICKHSYGNPTAASTSSASRKVSEKGSPFCP